MTTGNDNDHGDVKKDRKTSRNHTGSVSRATRNNNGQHDPTQLRQYQTTEANQNQSQRATEAKRT
jgi:hypothetical protein